MNLLHWQRANHKVVALVSINQPMCFFSRILMLNLNLQIGGATAQIGDPSGKSKDRDKQSSHLLAHNVKGISSSLQAVFDNHAKYFWKSKDLLPEPM